LKLHIGCGKCYVPGWTNLDIGIFDDAIVDVVDDARTLKTIKDGSCEIIYASHVLEHFGRHDHIYVLQVWRRKLRPGGILRISVPDFDKVVEKYNETSDLELISGFLLGGQRTSYDYHNMIFNKSSLEAALRAAAFSEVNEWDWRNVSHAHIDDYSQAYLPHMDKEGGLLMSLNLEAVK